MTSISILIIANQSSHDDKSTSQCFIHVLCPQLIRNVRSRQRIDSFSIIAHPVNSDLHTWERSLKCYDKNSIYLIVMNRGQTVTFGYIFYCGGEILVPTTGKIYKQYSSAGEGVWPSPGGALGLVLAEPGSSPANRPSAQNNVSIYNRLKT